MEKSVEQQTQSDISFLSRIARKQTPDRQEDPAEFLLNTARLRICLSTAAELLERATAQGGLHFESHICMHACMPEMLNPILWCCELGSAVSQLSQAGIECFVLHSKVEKWRLISTCDR